MLSRLAIRRTSGRYFFMTKIIEDFNEEHHYSRIQNGVYISPYPTPPETEIYNNLEQTLKLASGGRFQSAIWLLSIQSVYYFYKIYTPFSYLYFGGSVGFSLFTFAMLIGNSMHRFHNLADMALISPNRVRIIRSDGTRNEVLISEIKQTRYQDNRRSLLGHQVTVSYSSKTGQFQISESTAFNPEIFWAVLHPEVTHVMDQESAQQFNRSLQQGIRKVQNKS